MAKKNDCGSCFNCTSLNLFVHFANILKQKKKKNAENKDSANVKANVKYLILNIQSGSLILRPVVSSKNKILLNILHG